MRKSSFVGRHDKQCTGSTHRLRFCSNVTPNTLKDTADQGQGLEDVSDDNLEDNTTTSFAKFQHRSLSSHGAIPPQPRRPSHEPREAWKFGDGFTASDDVKKSEKHVLVNNEEKSRKMKRWKREDQDVIGDYNCVETLRSITCEAFDAEGMVSPKVQRQTPSVALSTAKKSRAVHASLCAPAQRWMLHVIDSTGCSSKDISLSSTSPPKFRQPASEGLALEHNSAAASKLLNDAVQIPDAFSPHRRGRRYIPGGMAETTGAWVSDVSARLLSSKAGRKESESTFQIVEICNADALVIFVGRMIEQDQAASVERDKTTKSANIILAGRRCSSSDAAKNRREKIYCGSVVALKSPLLESRSIVHNSRGKNERRWIVAMDWEVW